MVEMLTVLESTISNSVIFAEKNVAFHSFSAKILAYMPYLMISFNDMLTLKASRKTASENVVCICRLLNILANFSNLFLRTDSVDPDRTAPKRVRNDF